MLGPLRIAPIPALLHSEASGAPFTHCLLCDRDLLDSLESYFIEKAFRSAPGYDARETTFEYAICLPCYETLSASLSEASRARIQQFMDERVDFAGRAATLLGASDASASDASASSADVARWLDRCVVDGTPAAALDEYQLIAHCRGNRLMLSHLPCLIGGDALDAMTALLSNETLGELGGFQQEHLGPSPDLEELLTGPRPVLL